MKTAITFLLSTVAMHSAFAASPVAGGKKLYDATCAMCHGQELKASGGIPDLRETKLDDQGFRTVVKNGRPGTIMPPMKNTLNDEEIAQIRAYVRASSGK